MLDARRTAPAAVDRVARRSCGARSDATLPAGWVLSASAFNWTPESSAPSGLPPTSRSASSTDGLASEIEARARAAVALLPGRERRRCRRASASACTRPAVASASWARASTTGRRTARAARTTSGSRSSCRSCEIAHQLGARGRARCRSGRPASRCCERVLPMLHETRPRRCTKRSRVSRRRLAARPARAIEPDRRARRPARPPAGGHQHAHAVVAAELPRRCCARAACRRSCIDAPARPSGATPRPWARSSTCCDPAACRHPCTRST